MSIVQLRAESFETDVASLPADVPVPNPLPKLLAGEDLPIEDSEHLFERLVLGRLEPAEGICDLSIHCVRSPVEVS